MSAFTVTYSIYADVVLANNFVMDYLLLTVVKKLMKLETRRAGRPLASLMGAFYALAAALWPIPVPVLQSIVTYCGVSALMASMAFRIRSAGALVRASAGLYLAAVMTAGLMELLGVGTGSSFAFYGAAAVLSLRLTELLWRLVSETGAKNGHLYHVVIEYRGETAGFTGFLDTGNRLTEPYGGNPVSVIAADSCEGLFSTLDAVCFVPFHSVGKDDGIMPAIRVDRMEIGAEGEKRIIEKPYVAISREKLSEDGSYQILLNEKLWM